MKILIINTLYAPYKVGGAEVSVQLLAEGLVAEGHEVKILCLHPLKQRKESIVNGVNVVYLPLINKYWPFGEYKASKLEKIFWHILDNYNPFMANKVEKEILKYKPDVVHTNNLTGFSVSVWPMVKRNNIPLIHTSRDYYLFHPNCTLFKHNKIQDINCKEVKIWSFLKKKMAKHVDFYVGISEFIKDFHVNNDFFNKEKSLHIYNAVNKIEKTKFNENDKVIGFIGRLTTDKGFNVFCDMAGENKNNLKFLAAGNFSNNLDGEILKNKALKANINIIGFSDFKNFINLVDGVVLPIQWNEPFGRVIVECALSGINVYTNKRGGITELFDYFDNIFEINDNFSFEKHNVNDKVDFLTKNITNKYINIYKSV